MQQFDAHLFRLVNSHLACPALDPVMLALTVFGAGVGQTAMCLIIVWLGWLRGSVLTRRAGYAGLIACAATGLASPIFKMLFSRPRPILAMFDVRIVDDPLFANSFPSGHATTSFAVAVALSAFLPRLRWLFLPLAALIGISRVYVGAHFPMDVLGGAVLGTGIGMLAARAAIGGEWRVESGKPRNAGTMPFVALAAACLVLFFWRIGGVPLVGLDESMYAESAREMAVGGSWIVPHYNGVPFFDKPPLGYWLMAASMRALGVNSFAARLPSAIAGLALIALTVALGSRLYGRRAGILAGFALASCMLTAALARMAILDMLFALTITVALGMFLLSYLELVPRWGYLAFWAATGLSIMVKGPAGAVLILGTVAAFLLIRRRPGQFRRMMPIVGLLVVLAVTLPWYAAIQRESGGTFLREFVVHQNIERAMGKDFHHNMPFYFYLPIYLVGFFPWSVFVPVAWAARVRLRPADAEQEASLFAAVWIAAMLLAFSISRSKLPAYIYPIYPPSALLVGAAWVRAVADPSDGYLKRSIVAALAVALPVGAAILIGPRFLPKPIPGLYAALVPMGAAMILGAACAFVFALLRRPGAAFASLCAGMAVFVLTATVIGLPIASRTIGDPAVKLAGTIRKIAPPKTAIVGYQISTLVPSLPFYAGRPVQFVKDPAQLDTVAGSGKPFVIVVRNDRSEVVPANTVQADQVGQYLVFKGPIYRGP